MDSGLFHWKRTHKVTMKTQWNHAIISNYFTILLHSLYVIFTIITYEMISFLQLDADCIIFTIITYEMISFLQLDADCND